MQAFPMCRTIASLLVTTAACALAVGLACSQRTGSPDTTSARPPGDSATPAHKPAAGNACLACHASFADEPIVRIHAKKTIGCARCHGESTAHIEQQGAAPPDRVIRHADVDKSCGHCHTHGCKSATGRAAAGIRVCTDCHGEHRLALAGR